MRRLRRTTLWVVPLLFLIGTTATAGLYDQYVFQYGTGSGIDMSGSTTLMSSGDDDVWSRGQEIGFDFYLGDQMFTYFTASTNGPLMLGNSSSFSFTYIYAYNSFNSGDCPHPVITAFFDDMVASGNGVRTKLVGTAPNRVRVVEWEGYLWYGSGTSTEYSFQVRLYEGSNRVELWYRSMPENEPNDGNGQIGMALTTSDYVSVIVGNPPIASAGTTINDLSSAGIPDNTLYTFVPCQRNITIAGYPAEGGTATMDSGAVLLRDFRSKVGTALNLEPFTISMGEYPCGSITYRYEITGDHAAEYSITPSEGGIGSFQNLTPTLTFTPSDTGLREATLKITDNKGFNRSYTLRGEGFRCVDWVGDPDEGGTLMLQNGDVLLEEFQVPIGNSASYTPIRINQLSSDGGCQDPVSISYQLNDPTGNYEISPASQTVPVGGSAVPVITFNAMNGVGFQEATLTVNADGEVRTFTLRNFISAPGGEIRFEGTAIGPERNLFRNMWSCVGTEIISLPLEAVNIGTGNFIVYNLQGVELDTVLRQGVPNYPVVFDEFGQPVEILDYYLSLTPGGPPPTDGGSFDSLVVPEGGSRGFYLNFRPVRDGRRFGMLYFPTNAFNLKDADVFGDSVVGLTRTHVFARGLGSHLAGNLDGARPEALVFDATKVRESRTMTARMYNSGNCNLLIDQRQLSIMAGDVGEFEILSWKGGVVQGDRISLAPDSAFDITVRFTPARSGSRRATLMIPTNDSTLVIPQITERGVFYLELYGKGKLDLEVRDLNLDPAVIGAESSRGVVPLENTKLENVTIEKILMVGDDGEIIEDDGNQWPDLPITLGPGEQLDLGVVLLPNPDSSEGVREVELLIILTNGDTARARVTGYAGSRTLAVNPSSLFEGVQVQVGEIVRRYVAITNTGTLPTTITQVRITGANATEYALYVPGRRVLPPGESEFFEVTYAPTTPGVHSATVEILSNSTNGTQTITLGGEGMSTSPIGGGSIQSRTISPAPGEGTVRPGLELRRGPELE